MLSWCTGYIDFNLTKLMIKKNFWVKDIFFCTPVVLKINYLDGNPEDPPRDGDTTIECLHEDCLGLILNMVINCIIFHFHLNYTGYPDFWDVWAKFYYTSYLELASSNAKSFRMSFLDYI